MHSYPREFPGEKQQNQPNQSRPAGSESNLRTHSQRTHALHSIHYAHTKQPMLGSTFFVPSIVSFVHRRIETHGRVIECVWKEEYRRRIWAWIRGFIIRVGNGLGTGTTWVLERRIVYLWLTYTHREGGISPRWGYQSMGYRRMSIKGFGAGGVNSLRYCYLSLNPRYLRDSGIVVPERPCAQDGMRVMIWTEERYTLHTWQAIIKEMGE